jgi:hypothetical protein
MVNHYWDGTRPAETACLDWSIGDEFVPHVSVTDWGLVSCPECLDTERLSSEAPTPPAPKPVDAWDLDLTELLQEVGILMRDRHKKYGPGNISKRGIPGVLVRLDDKLARIDNGDMDYADESYRDAWMDVVGYGLIALMAIDGNWPGLAKASLGK